MRKISVLFIFISISAAANSEWSGKMQGLSQTMSELLPDIVSSERFNSPKNFKRIEQNTKKLSSLTHKLKGAPDADPSIPFIAGMIGTEAARASRELKRGNRNYARSILKEVTGYCIGCHTRSNSGPQFAKLDLDKTISGLSLFEKAELFTATRQFDRAITEFQSLLSDPALARSRSIEWERAARNALAIAVRVKRDPDLASKIAERVVATPTAPLFLKENAQAWKDSILKWKSETSRKIETEQGLFAESTRLMTVAFAQQKYPADRSADVQFLRASAVLHDLLRVAPEGKHTGEALLLLGTAYEALRDLGLWSLHEMYYKACIQRSPHTEIALKCYARLEESVFAGYSGSGGVEIPSDIATELNELKKKAE